VIVRAQAAEVVGFFLEQIQARRERALAQHAARLVHHVDQVVGARAIGEAELGDDPVVLIGGEQIGEVRRHETRQIEDVALRVIAEHADVLDRDLPTAPTLVTLRIKGKSVDALAQTTKQGFVFVLDRDTGKPVFPVEEVPAPPSDMPGEVTTPTYLRPTLPAPYARQRLTANELTTRTPEAAAWARQQFAQLRSDGPFKPLATGVDTTIYPGFDGGAEWGGPAWDPDTGLLYVNANEMAWLGSLALNDTGHSTGKSIYLRECAACHGDNLQGSPPQFPTLVALSKRMTPADFTAFVRKGGGRMPGFASLQDEAMSAIAMYLFEGKDVPAGAPDRSAANQPYRFTGWPTSCCCWAFP